MKFFNYTIANPDSPEDDDEYVIFAVNQYRANEVFLAATGGKPEIFGWTGEEMERFETAGGRIEEPVFGAGSLII